MTSNDKKIILFSGLDRNTFNSIAAMLRGKGFKFDADKSQESDYSLEDIHSVNAVHMLTTRLFFPSEKAVEIIAYEILDRDTILFIVDRYTSYAGIKDGVLGMLSDSERD